MRKNGSNRHAGEPVTLGGVKLARLEARAAMGAKRGGSWDQRRAPSWRRAGPRAVVSRSGRRLALGLITGVVALALGGGIGFLVARAAGLI